MKVSYNIFAKILTLRVVEVLPSVINSAQTGFVKGGYILENLITCWEAMDWAKESNQQTCMFLLDYEKAYDKVEWNFILMMLQALGLPPFFCQMIATLMNGACATMEVNGVRSAPF